MAIEVVREPEKTNFPILIDCPHCNAGLKIYEKEDVNYSSFGKTRGCSLSIACPRCNQKIELNSDLFSKVDLILMRQAYEQKVIEAYQNSR